jgi:serine/threonine protein kinase
MIQEKLEQKKTIDDMFENIDPLLLDLIKKMLAFSPQERISAEECIASPYFDDFRSDYKQSDASKQVECPNQFKSKNEAIQFLINEVKILNS